MDQGLDVVKVHLCSTDELYYASGSMKWAGAMFTASHNPSQYNGIKMCRAGARPIGTDTGLAEIRDVVASGEELVGERTGEVREEEITGLFERDVLVFHASRQRRSYETQHEGLVFGRLDLSTPDVRYIGRIGVRDDDYEPLVIDWRAPAAAVFYQATAAEPQGVVRRRVLRAEHRTVVGVEDELLDDEELLEEDELLDESSGEDLSADLESLDELLDESSVAAWVGAVVASEVGSGVGST